MEERWLTREEEEFRLSLLSQWTKGLSPIEQRISVFSHIRDIPYAIIPGWRFEKDIIRLMIVENRGWCGPKHYLLMWMFEKLGIKTEPYNIPFRWQDQKVQYPALLEKYLQYLPDTNHLCCKALLNKQWQIIDATWDPRLKKAGFPINDPWNGISGTIPAVLGINESNRIPPRDSVPVFKSERFEFTAKLNKWMEEIRSDKI
ncbi:MAG: hypothetical protein GXY48_04055 [Methanomicrobiales archaeon]|nr:hypothetical protein [Methanomicrobiales archaeon]